MNKQDYKTIPITKRMVFEAYKMAKKGGKTGGVDGVDMKSYDEDLENNLYKLWNRLTSGSYFPSAVKRVMIPKGNGESRPLGIPTINDRIAQMVIKHHIEDRLEEEFENASYGYRKGRSAHDALTQVRLNVRKRSWVIDLDIKGFFDNMDHELLKRALDLHVEEKWVKMYITRWLEAAIELRDGTLEENAGIGVPQGGVISPILSNLFLHYALDKWLKQKYPEVVLVRYSDDVIVHCNTKEEAEKILEVIANRMQECKLNVHSTKTKIVFCKRIGRHSEHSIVKFDFLGYSFQPRTKKSRFGLFLGYDCEISNESRKKIRGELKKMEIHRWSSYTILEISRRLNPKLRGWINYYGKFGKYGLRRVFRNLDHRLVKWVMKRYKNLRGRIKKGYNALKKLKGKHPEVFEHWKVGLTDLKSK